MEFYICEENLKIEMNFLSKLSYILLQENDNENQKFRYSKSHGIYLRDMGLNLILREE